MEHKSLKDMIGPPGRRESIGQKWCHTRTSKHNRTFRERTDSPLKAWGELLSNENERERQLHEKEGRVGPAKLVLQRRAFRAIS